jgi:hypothetical protein
MTINPGLILLVHGKAPFPPMLIGNQELHTDEPRVGARHVMEICAKERIDSPGGEGRDHQSAAYPGSKRKRKPGTRQV